ncbi:uracil phosphoribosyltransferase [Jiulongibacter sp. NS-SX5]|uniref:uracil phosphoribosyltransferase n=1 Tax=Jiulongibacter sp. NS-SX5 TaxID=3463854 RepID=UPI004059009C
MYILTETSSIANHFLANLRDENYQKDRAAFRRNIMKLGEILAYEISKNMTFKNAEINTPLGTKETRLLAEQPIICTIMRAGLQLHQGIQNYFESADSAFIGAYRGKHDSKDDFDIEMDYISSPNIQGKTLIICDPMIASGKSIEKAYHAMLRYGIPKRTYLVGVIASARGARFVQARMPECRLYLGDLDKDLNSKSYIIPGLGDAGDLCYGEKT